MFPVGAAQRCWCNGSNSPLHAPAAAIHLLRCSEFYLHAIEKSSPMRCRTLPRCSRRSRIHHARRSAMHLPGAVARPDRARRFARWRIRGSLPSPCATACRRRRWMYSARVQACSHLRSPGLRTLANCPVRSVPCLRERSWWQPSTGTGATGSRRGVPGPQVSATRSVLQERGVGNGDCPEMAEPGTAEVTSRSTINRPGLNARCDRSRCSRAGKRRS